MVPFRKPVLIMGVPGLRLEVSPRFILFFSYFGYRTQHGRWMYYEGNYLLFAWDTSTLL